MSSDHLSRITSSARGGCMRLRPRCASAPDPAPPLDGNRKHASQSPLRVSPCPCPHLAQELLLRPGPEWSGTFQGSGPSGCQPHGLDAPVVVRNALDHAVSLQETEAARQRRLIDGERVLELAEVRLTHARDGRENAELGHAEAARPQDVVVELGHSPTHHPEGTADTGGQPPGIRSPRPGGALSVHGFMLPPAALSGKDFVCR